MLKVTARTPLHPTEDTEKVKGALLNLFPGGEISEVEGQMTLVTDDLSHFMETIRRQRILDATRSTLLRGMGLGQAVFQLNKQAASAGKVSMAEGKAPLGNITVEIESEEIEKAIDEIAPMTVDGEVVR